MSYILNQDKDIKVKHKSWGVALYKHILNMFEKQTFSISTTLLIQPRPVKKIPKIGDDKYVIESRVVFEPEDSSVSSGWLDTNIPFFFS